MEIYYLRNTIFLIRRKDDAMNFAIFSTRIFTGNPAQPWAEALKVTDDRVTHVGSNAEIKKACGTNTEMFDLPGRLVTPGLVDAHCHFFESGTIFSNGKSAQCFISGRSP